MKKEGVLKFLAAGTHLGGPNLDLEMEQHISSRKSDGVYTVNLKRTREKLLPAARVIVAIETLLLSASCPPGTPASELRSSLLLPLEPLPLLTMSLLAPSPTRSGR